MKCPFCRNPIDIESVYSGKCLFCDFLLRTAFLQNFIWTLELSQEVEQW
jgi:hypothetical protein